MFVTGLTYQNIIDREPAIADFIPDYATSLQARIDEAKAVIDNRLRGMGYDLNLIGKKTDLWDWDNEELDTLTKTLTNPDSTQNLFIVCFKEGISNGTFQVLGRASQTIIHETGFTVSAGATVCRIIPYIDTTVTIKLIQENPFDAIGVKAYLTDPAIYFLHLYKSLQLIYGSMRSAPGDLFEMQMNYYSDLYETEFNSLATYYDRNGDGTMQNEEMQHLKRTRVFR